ncbi:aminotransferase class I/II-fold pyridoxal phosphate-dependent enzyme [Escherichia coli]
MANGSYAPHLALEKEIAEFFNRPTAIVFSTGYTANLGVISALADHNAVVLLDADSHASIYDACSGCALFVSAITMLADFWNGAWFASVNGRKRRLSSLRVSTACSVTLRR